MKSTLVIAESHGLMRGLLALAVSTEVQMNVTGLCAGGHEVLALCDRQAPNVLLIGCALEDMSCVSLLKKVHANYPATRVVMLTGEGNGEVLAMPIHQQPHGIFHRDDPLPVFYEVLRAVTRGARYHSEHVIRHANGGNGTSPPVKLTERECEVLSLLARGSSSKQIAHDLKLSPKTVDHYRADLMKKLNIHDVAGLTRHALKAGLVNLE